MTKAAAGSRPAPPARKVVPKAEQARRTRALIVETGMRCIAEQGFANTTMLSIAREAGLSRGPMHYHFADRNELMAAIAEALPRGMSRELLDRLRAPKTLEERLQTLVQVALEEHLGPHHFVAMELLLAARKDPELLTAIRPHFLASELEIDEWWTHYFALLRWPVERLVAFRHVSVACLRGLALDHLLQGDAEAHNNALELFRDMFMAIARARLPYE